MTDFDAFSPDPVPDADDPFAPAPEASEDPFAAPAAAEDDPFASGEAEAETNAAEEGDPFEAGGGDFNNEGAFDAAVEALPQEEEQELSLAPESSADTGAVLPESVILGEWQSNRDEVLRGRRDEAREKKEAQRETAKAELATFLEERQERLVKLKTKNREEEKNFITDMETTMAHGTQWEKVHKLVNLQPSANEKPGSSKVDRMRALLIRLKHE